MMRDTLNRFFCAWLFFTRLPAPAWVLHDEHTTERAACFGPLIGCVVGGVGALVLYLAGLTLPLSIAVFLCLLTMVWITGALHEDGFGDFCDGLGAGGDPEQFLAVMKDPRIGVFAAIGIVFMVLAKYLVLLELASGFHGRLVAPNVMLITALTLVGGHSLSRLAAVTFMLRFDYVRQNGRSGPMANPMSHGEGLFAALCGLVPLLALAVLVTPWLVLALIPTAIGRYLVGQLFIRRLGGYTGDCLGAVQQVSEVLFYFGVCAVMYQLAG